MKAQQPNILNTPMPDNEVSYIREELLLISKEIETEYPIESAYLLKVKENLFRKFFPAPNIMLLYINPYVLGEAVGILETLNKRAALGEGQWAYVHPRIRHASEKLYVDGNFANAACDAFIEINVRVKKLYSIFEPGEHRVPDGDAAMNKVFSVNAPMLKFCDQSSETGFNIQKGFMQMLAGAMSALRNPKAHENIRISREDAMRRIIFASMLMYKIDEAVQYSGVQEL